MSPIIKSLKEKAKGGNRRIPRGALSRIAEYMDTSPSTVLAWMRGATPREEHMLRLGVLLRCDSFEFGNIRKIKFQSKT